MAETPLVSVFASAYRTWLWKGFMESLKGTSIPYEVIFCGQNEPDFEHPNMKYIKCNNKIGECYERARRACRGEVVHWTADDAEYTPDLLAVGYNYLKSLPEKSIVSMQTVENTYLNDMNTHRFFAGRGDTPLMAPLGFMNREYLESLGGIDSRYSYGQWENDIVMRVMADGGNVYVCGDGKNAVLLNHNAKHDMTRLQEMIGYHKQGRAVLEGSWLVNGEITLKRTDKFCPYQL